MPKFKILELKNDKIILNNKDIDHIKKSLRKKENDIIICYDENFNYKCKIISLKKFELKLLEKDCYLNEANNINIYLGSIKKNYFEFAVRKLNELNCKSITPILFNRTQKNNYLNNERLEKIIFESSKQCNRNSNLILNKEINFIELINLIKNNKYNFVGDQNSNNSNLELFDFKNENVNLIIGSEGGFTQDELMELKKYCKTIKLTNTILKSETAAIVLASVAIYEMSKINEKR